MEIKKTVYVQNEDRFIYKIADLEMRADGWLNIWLDLVCGIDYINADESNATGYVGKENFVEEIQHEIYSCDIMNESVTQALEFHGFKVIEGLPTIHGARNIETLSAAVEKYNELQTDESARLDWWGDVIDNLNDMQDEKEIEKAIAEINEKIELLKKA